MSNVLSLLDLKRCVDQAVKQHRDPERVRVCVPSLKLGVVGHIPVTNIVRASLGFDWENNSFILTPESKLREIDHDEIALLKKKYEELSWKKTKIDQMRREDKMKIKRLEKLVSELEMKLDGSGGSE